MNRRTCIASIACILFAIAACDNASTTDVNTDTSITGTYSAQSLDGHALPYTRDNEVLTSASLELKADNTWSVSFVSHLTSGADNSFQNHGTYIVSGNAIVLHSLVEDSDTPGTFNGTTLTVNGDDGVYVLKKN